MLYNNYIRIINMNKDDKTAHEKRLDKRENEYKNRWDNFKNSFPKKSIPGISSQNANMIYSYVKDMELGLNVSSKSCKGGRSHRRLIDLKDRLTIFAKWFEEKYNINDMSKLTEQDLHTIFHDIREGNIKNRFGQNYKSIDTLGKAFKAFWHWWVKVNRKKGVAIEDITQDLDVRGEKPDWVYLDEEQLRQLADSAKFEHKVLIWFLIDTGLRPPLELLPIKVSDLYEDCTQLNIRVYKKNSFSRKIKLMLCPELLRQYIQVKNKKPDDYLFEICPEVINRNLKKYAIGLFGKGETLAGKKYGDISMYDFRHCSCCYWLPRYTTESALKYRFGWKKTDKIHYYSEMLGMRDTIQEEDLLIDVTKTEIENRLVNVERENTLLREKLNHMMAWMQKMDSKANEIELELV